MAKLSFKARKGLSKSQFVFPERVGEGKSGGPAGRGAYPIPDIAHARNALARVAQHGTSAEQARVRAAVKRKFPSIDVGGKRRKGGRAGIAAALSR